MVKGIKEFMYLLEVDTFWGYLIIILLVLLEIVKCIYPWQPKWKSKRTKDKNGEVTIYYKLKD